MTTLEQKIKEFDAYQKANPKTAEQLLDDAICNFRANAVLNGYSIDDANGLLNLVTASFAEADRKMGRV